MRPRWRPTVAMHPVMDRLITDLHRIRRVRMITRVELAKLTGIDRSRIGKIERKQLKDMTFWTISKLADALDYEFQISLRRKP